MPTVSGFITEVASGYKTSNEHFFYVKFRRLSDDALPEEITLWVFNNFEAYGQLKIQPESE